MKAIQYFVLFALLSRVILGFKASSSKNKLKRQDPFSTLFDVQKKFASITACNRFDLTMICKDYACVQTVKTELRTRKMINSIQTQPCSVWLSFQLKAQANTFSNHVNAEISNNGKGTNGIPSAGVIGEAQKLINQFNLAAQIVNSPLFNAQFNINSLNNVAGLMTQNLSKMKAFRDALTLRVGFITDTASKLYTANSSPPAVAIDSCWKFVGDLIDNNTCTMKQ